MWSAANALHGPFTSYERSTEQLATARNIATVRAQMDGEAFDTAWAAGQAMSMEDVVRFGGAL